MNKCMLRRQILQLSSQSKRKFSDWSNCVTEELILSSASSANNNSGCLTMDLCGMIHDFISARMLYFPLQIPQSLKKHDISDHFVPGQVDMAYHPLRQSFIHIWSRSQNILLETSIVFDRKDERDEGDVERKIIIHDVAHSQTKVLAGHEVMVGCDDDDDKPQPDGPALMARFSGLLRSVVVHPKSGDILASDGHAVRRLRAADGIVETVAGHWSDKGNVNGFGPLTRLGDLFGMCIHPCNGNLFVCEDMSGSCNTTIRCLIPHLDQVDDAHTQATRTNYNVSQLWNGRVEVESIAIDPSCRTMIITSHAMSWLAITDANLKSSSAAEISFATRDDFRDYDWKYWTFFDPDHLIVLRRHIESREFELGLFAFHTGTWSQPIIDSNQYGYEMVARIHQMVVLPPPTNTENANGNDADNYKVVAFLTLMDQHIGFIIL